MEDKDTNKNAPAKGTSGTGVLSSIIFLIVVIIFMIILAKIKGG